jgi:hypothetical protein
VRQERAKRIAFGSCCLLLVVLFGPGNAFAQFGGLFSVIISTISGPIGGALTEINQVRGAVLKTEQQVVWPLALIVRARNYATTIKTSYRAWMNSVYSIRVNSAVLPTSRSLEAAFLSGRIGQITEYGRAYTAAYGPQPAFRAAPPLNLQMMDIEDATARDATAQSIAADQATDTMLQAAQTIEDQVQTTAPGTAGMLAASARTAELASLAMQHKLLAYELREAAIQLGHRGAVTKQSTTNMQNLNQQILTHIGGGQ